MFEPGCILVGVFLPEHLPRYHHRDDAERDALCDEHGDINHQRDEHLMAQLDQYGAL